MRIISILIIALCIGKVSKGQTSPTLSQLMDLANCSTLSQFDTKVRDWGYVLEEQKKEDNTTNTTYIKKEETATKFYNFVLEYTEISSTHVVYFYASSNAVPNLITNIRKQATSLQFVESNWCPEALRGIRWCYENTNWHLQIFDEPIRKTDISYNQFQIKVWKK